MLDEREEGLRIARDRIKKRGHAAILIDSSIRTGGIQPSLKADITCDEVDHARKPGK